ncbi:zinc finger protein 665-like isoform X2 [Mytilus californianus]|uniref:zinc finger protein 665-like isoform X2 n=1 Tax=Mytilus californianus TaxID=6549 RepID=UPI002246E834|nr:zinc finger protein 665-like isoform X2 [Mytilus californianus]
MEIEEDIWREARSLCKKLQDYGNDTVVMSINRQTEKTTCQTSDPVDTFLDKNPDCLQKFKDFCLSLYASTGSIQNEDEVKVQDKSWEKVNQSVVGNQSSDEDTEDYSDYETMKDPPINMKNTKTKLQEKNQKLDSEISKKEEIRSKTIKPKIRTVDSIVISSKEKTFNTSAPKKRKMSKSVKNDRTTRVQRKTTSSTVGKSRIETKGSCERELTQGNTQFSADKSKENMATDIDLYRIGAQWPSYSITCQICQMNWSSKIAYVNHIRSHKEYQICSICDELIHVKDMSIETHISEKHSDINPFKCTICGRGYKSKNGVRNHYVAVHADSSARFWCELCNRAFGTNNNYKTHMRSHKERKHCFMCKQEFENLELLRKHMKDSHAYYLCLICNRYFPDELELKEHEETHSENEKKSGINHDIRKFYDSSNEDVMEKDNNQTNNHDNAGSTGRKNLRELFLKLLKNPDIMDEDKKAKNKTTSNDLKGGKEENISSKSSQQCGTARKSFKCKFCGRVFKLGIAFARHVKLHNNQSTFKCQHCGKTCKNEETFKHHMILHLPDEKRPHRCQECGKGFATSTCLKKHFLVHSKLKEYVCEFCGQCCRDMTTLKIHRRSHTGERPYKCKSCPKTYRSWDALRNHQQSVHLPKKSYMCDICGKFYTQKHRLYEHKRTHREDGLKCDVCGIKALSVAAVRRHLVLEHLEIAKERGYKIYTCDYCQKILPNKEKYDYHIRQHTGARPFSCLECNKSFRDRKQLKIHMRIHLNDKKYSCSVCNKSFLYNRTLKKHLLTHQTENDPRPRHNFSTIDVDPSSIYMPCETRFSDHIYSAVCRSNGNLVSNSNTSHRDTVQNVHHLNTSHEEPVQNVHQLNTVHGFPMNYYTERHTSETYGSENPLVGTFNNLYSNQNLGQN